MQRIRARPGRMKEKQNSECITTRKMLIRHVPDKMLSSKKKTFRAPPGAPHPQHPKRKSSGRLRALGVLARSCWLQRCLHGLTTRYPLFNAVNEGSTLENKFLRLPLPCDRKIRDGRSVHSQVILPESGHGKRDSEK